ncbi:MAG: DNA-binding response OmpR family regulator [Gammaproteobacteria bacterium]|jgi:DNA-binding response OmpR family regulator
MNLLLIEDDLDVATNLWEYFEAAGEVVDHAADGLTGLHLTATNTYDVIILDIGLPGLDGVALATHLRQSTNARIPIIMLTARDTLDAKLRGFAAGADDYLVKPFALAELGARVNALMARSSGRLDGTLLGVGDLSFNPNSLHAQRDGNNITLTRSGYLILERLMRQTHRVVRRAELEGLIWGENVPESDALRSHIHALRKAIDRPFNAELLHTIPSIGYRVCERRDLHKT